MRVVYVQENNSMPYVCCSIPALNVLDGFGCLHSNDKESMINSGYMVFTFGQLRILKETVERSCLVTIEYKDTQYFKDREVP